MSGVLEDRVLMVLPFMILLLPLAGFIVLCLFGDAIRRHGESRGAGILTPTPLGPARVDVGYNRYSRTQGPLYRIESNGDLTLVRDAFSTPQRSRLTFHVAVGQAF